jgi:hypothetical protein
MRKIALILTSTALAGAAAAPALNAQAQTLVPKAKATVVTCSPSLDQTQRFAVFQGEMQALKGATRMQMRFGLFQQLPGQGFKPVIGTGLDLWSTARPNVATYKFRKRVENLVAPATYRSVITYRWLTKKGKVLRKVQRVTPACHEPDLRPNLKPGALSGHGAGKKLAVYNLAVRNFGRTAAGPFDVIFSVNDQPQPAQTVASLAGSGGRQVVSVTAPRCTPGSTIKAVIDPDNRVAETNEADNEITVACPLKG